MASTVFSHPRPQWRESRCVQTGRPLVSVLPVTPQNPCPDLKTRNQHHGCSKSRDTCPNECGFICQPWGMLALGQALWEGHSRSQFLTEAEGRGRAASCSRNAHRGEMYVVVGLRPPGFVNPCRRASSRDWPCTQRDPSRGREGLICQHTICREGGKRARLGQKGLQPHQTTRTPRGGLSLPEPLSWMPWAIRKGAASCITYLLP